MNPELKPMSSGSKLKHSGHNLIYSSQQPYEVGTVVYPCFTGRETETFGG